MTLDLHKAASRPLGVAQKLLKQPIDEDAFFSKEVVLTGEREVLLHQNGQWCFLDALALLSRVVGGLTIVLPPEIDEFAADVASLCQRVWSRSPIRLTTDASSIVLADFDAILNVGSQVPPQLPWTTINSNGWVARVSSDASKLPTDVDQPNPIGALMAASLGVSEVFKRLICVSSEVAPLLARTEFSLFELATNSASIGPRLPDELAVSDTLLVGAGAIGNGIALLLSRLKLRGRVHVVDKQDYADENLGTCVLLEADGWIGQPKASRLAAWLNDHSDLCVTGERSTIAAALGGGTVRDLAVDLILTGLDDLEARRDAQGAWPAVIVDGGINEVGAAVTQHRIDHEGLACLKCWFDSPKHDERQIQSRLTGLSFASLDDIGRELADDDIAHAAEDKRDWLIERKKEGKTLCSIISEAALLAKLGIAAEEGFRPSVPFVATAAASLVLAEAMKSIAFRDAPVTGMFQIASLFTGPEDSSIHLRRAPTITCQCHVHREMIKRLRDARARTAGDNRPN
jgi:molybdopterin/thiamine biosynthesis adenylyltransferase